MKRAAARDDAAPLNPFRTWVPRIAFATVLVLPLLVIYGGDSFRLPKLLLFEAVSIVLAALLAVAWLLGRPVTDGMGIRHPTRWIPLAAVVWTAFTTLTSTNRTISWICLLWVASCAAFFFASTVSARDRGLGTIVALAFPALANIAVYLMQEHRVWQPFRMPDNLDHHARSVGLLGNPGDIGIYLVAPALAMAVLALVRPRIAYIALAIALALGIMSTLTLTAIIGYVAGAVAVLAVRFRRRAIVPAVATAAIGILIVIFYPPLKRRFLFTAEQLAVGNFDMIVTGRASPMLTAAAMFKDRPLVGKGPGTYGYHFYEYRFRVEDRFPRLVDSPLRNVNAAQAHNDHLQTLATTGLPGYLIYLCALWYAGCVSWRKLEPDASERERFGAWFALPFAIAFAIVGLAWFPLSLAAPTATSLYLLALCTGWRRDCLA